LLQCPYENRLYRLTPRHDSTAKDVITRLEIFTTKVLEAYHGDCPGSDADFHHLIREIDPAIRIIHPGFPANHSDDTTLRAFCEGDHTSEAKSFFARNRDIVDETDLLIATPTTKKETGGTWYTINYSRRQKKQRVIVYPDCSIGGECSMLVTMCGFYQHLQYALWS
jgi:hypothetical protein